MSTRSVCVMILASVEKAGTPNTCDTHTKTSAPGVHVANGRPWKVLEAVMGADVVERPAHMGGFMGWNMGGGGVAPARWLERLGARKGARG